VYEWHLSLSYEVAVTCSFQMSTITSSGLPPKAYIEEDGFKLQKTKVNNAYLYSSEVMQLNSSAALKIAHYLHLLSFYFSSFFLAGWGNISASIANAWLFKVA